MASPSRVIRLFSLLALLLGGTYVALLLSWTWNLLSRPDDWLRSIMLLPVGILFGAIGIPLTIQGVRLWRHPTVEAIRLAAALVCFVGVGFVHPFLYDWSDAFRGRSDYGLGSGIQWLHLTIIGVLAHVVICRQLLQTEGLPCPPINRFLSRMPIQLISVQVWLCATAAFQALARHHADEGTTQAEISLAGIIGGIVVAVVVHHLLAWCFSRTPHGPETTAGSHEIRSVAP